MDLDFWDYFGRKKSPSYNRNCNFTLYSEFGLGRGRSSLVYSSAHVMAFILEESILYCQDTQLLLIANVVVAARSDEFSVLEPIIAKVHELFHLKSKLNIHLYFLYYGIITN